MLISFSYHHLNRPSSTLLGQVPFTEVYVDSELYAKAIQLRGIRIFQFSCPLFFLNCDYFKEMLFTKTLKMPFGELLKRGQQHERQESQPAPSLCRQNRLRPENREDQMNEDSLSATNYGYVEDNQQTITSGNHIRISPQIHTSAFSRNSSNNQLFSCIYEADSGDETTVHTIIIDCSGISTIDSAGVRCLDEVIQDFQKISLHCYLANCPSPLLLMFKRMRFIDKLPANSAIFATIHDAVLHAFTRVNQLPPYNHPTDSQNGISQRNSFNANLTTNGSLGPPIIKTNDLQSAFADGVFLRSSDKPDQQSGQ